MTRPIALPAEALANGRVYGRRLSGGFHDYLIDPGSTMIMQNRSSLTLFLFTSALLPTFLFSTSCQKKVETQRNASIGIEDRIIDKADLLTGEEEQNLFQVITALENEIGSQVFIMTIETLEGESINRFSIHAAERLKIGREKEKDGILITVAYREHKTRIEVGYGLEKIIKDEVAAKIIREEMVPDFKTGLFYSGLYAAVIRVDTLIRSNRSLVGEMP